jgi:hypothetical protein
LLHKEPKFYKIINQVEIGHEFDSFSFTMRSWLINHNKNGSCIKIISTLIGYQLKCRHFTSMDVKFANTSPWIIPCEYLIFVSYPIFTFWRTYNHTWQNKMWGFGKNELKSFKIVVINYNFLHFKNLTRHVDQIWWILWTLEILKILEFDVLNFSKIFNKWWIFCMWWYIWTKIILATKYEKWKIYFKVRL